MTVHNHKNADMHSHAQHGNEGATSSAPPVLLPYQQAWVKDDSPVKLMEKSRRVGLSWSEAADDTLYAASAEGDDVWYIGYNQDMAQEFINDCAFWARQYNLAASAMEEEILKDEDKDILTFKIRFSSGNRITALSSRPSNLRGKQGRVVIDEAAFHEHLDELIKAAMALLMWGGQVRIISTHNGEANPFNDLIQEIRAGKKPYSLHRITLDEALADGLYQRICLTRGLEWSPEAETQWRDDLVAFYGDHAEEELFCVPSKGSGVFLPRALVESCMSPEIPVIRWQCKDGFAQLSDRMRVAQTLAWCENFLAPHLDIQDPNLPCYFGEDFGRSGDLTVITPLQENPGLVYRAPFVVELRNVPFEQQRQILFYIVDRLPRFRGGALDARGNGQYLAEVAMQRYGAVRIHQVMLTQPWYIENMPPYKAAFEDKSIILPKDADILDDHRAVKMTKGVAKVPENHRGKGRDGAQRHGDAAIACALAWYATRNCRAGELAYGHTDPDTNKRKINQPDDPRGQAAPGRLLNRALPGLFRRRSS